METITNSNNHYYEELTKDIRAYIEWNINLSDFSDRDELEERLNDDLWVEDSVTGNGSGSYTFDREIAKKNVLRAPELVEEMASEFCISAEEIGKHFLSEDWEWFDVSIRCYLLGQMISKVLDDMESAGKLTFAE